MKETPMLFNGDMVNALLDNRKTQTRRAVKSKRTSEGLLFDQNRVYRYLCSEHIESLEIQGYKLIENGDGFNVIPPCSYEIGDIIYVRETWAAGKCADSIKPSGLNQKTWLIDNGGLWYYADNTEPGTPISSKGKTRVSIHMPKWASRIKLEITDIRVERLNDISEEDAKAEGVAQCARRVVGLKGGCDSYLCGFRQLWKSINGDKSWDDNPWLWCISFKVVKK